MIHIKKGIKGDRTSATEWVVMNGTTPVATTESYWRISRMHSDGGDSNGVNVGNITATAVTDATVTAQITAGEGQTLMAIDTIPKGHIGLLTNWWGTINRDTSGAANADLNLLFVPYGFDNPFGSRIENATGLSTRGSSYVKRGFEPYKIVYAQTDIIVNCTNVTANDMKISAGFDMIIIEDSVL